MIAISVDAMSPRGCRSMIHPHQIFPAFNDIEHRRTKVAKLRTALDKFFRVTFREKFYVSVGGQADLNKCLHHYNYQRPHRGYRKVG